MNHPSYSLRQDEAALRFDFESVSNHRTIQKRVIYSPTDIPNLYNLALGDVNADGSLNDTVRSNNDDLLSVMATVIQTLFGFFQGNPECAVYFRGSDSDGTRIRLYRVIIGRELEKGRELFDIYGVYVNTLIEPFERNKPYIAFIIKQKLLS